MPSKVADELVATDGLVNEIRRRRLAILDEELKLAQLNTKDVTVRVDETMRQARFTNNANLRNRILPFVGVIQEEGVEQAVDILYRWARDSKDPITVRFTSPGGELTAGLVLYDALRGISQVENVPIKTVVLGAAFSMAAVLLQAGDERVITPNSLLMVHRVSNTQSEGYTTNASKATQDAKLLTTLDKMLASILSRRSSLTTSEILRRYTKGDWHLQADECVKFGFADRVGYS